MLSSPAVKRMRVQGMRMRRMRRAEGYPVARDRTVAAGAARGSGRRQPVVLELLAQLRLQDLAGGADAGSRRRTPRRPGSATSRSCPRRSASSSSRVTSAPGFFTTTSSGRSSHFGCAHADHRRLVHRRMRHRDVLEVDRADPFAAGLDHVLAAVGDLHDSRRRRWSPTSPVGNQPLAVDRDERRAASPLKYSLDDPRPAHQQVAGGLAVPGQLLAVVVDDLHVDAEDGAALLLEQALLLLVRRARSVLGLQRAQRAERRHLGHAPGVDAPRRRTRPAACDHRRRAGRAADHRALERARTCSLFCFM